VTIQSEIYNAVKARGYLDESKWTRDQLIVRQVVKLQEELGEAAKQVEVLPGRFPYSSNADRVLTAMVDLGTEAKEAFDSRPFDGPNILPDSLRAEIPDILIPLLVLAELLGIDVEQSARSKAESDIGRGVG
jgi:NTP pyrophosphatase (non-canonical NTP hydrolase)